MKHTFIGAFSLEEIQELTLVLEYQETTDRNKDTLIHLSGDYADYSIQIDEDGNCEIGHE